jgi:phage-related protein
MEKSISKKPIEEISASVKELSADIKQIRHDLSYILSKINYDEAKDEIQKQPAEQTIDEDIVEVKKSWWF